MATGSKAKHPRLQKAFGKAVRGSRNALGISQEELADRCGLDRTYIGGIERGERNPSLVNIWRIARALDVPPQGLVESAAAEMKKAG